MASGMGVRFWRPEAVFIHDALFSEGQSEKSYMYEVYMRLSLKTVGEDLSLAAQSGSGLEIYNPGATIAGNEVTLELLNGVCHNN